MQGEEVCVQPVNGRTGASGVSGGKWLLAENHQIQEQENELLKAEHRMGF